MIGRRKKETMMSHLMMLLRSVLFSIFAFFLSQQLRSRRMMIFLIVSSVSRSSLVFSAC